MLFSPQSTPQSVSKKEVRARPKAKKEPREKIFKTELLLFRLFMCILSTVCPLSGARALPVKEVSSKKMHETKFRKTEGKYFLTGIRRKRWFTFQRCSKRAKGDRNFLALELVLKTLQFFIYFVCIPGFVVNFHRISDSDNSTTAVLRDCILVPRRIHSIGGILFLHEFTGDDKPEARGVDVTSPCDQRNFRSKVTWHLNIALRSTCLQKSKRDGRSSAPRGEKKQRTYKNSCSITNW